MDTMESMLRKRYAEALQPITAFEESSGMNSQLQAVKENVQTAGEIAKNVAVATKEGAASYGQYLQKTPAAESIPTSLNELGKGFLSGLGGIIGDTESLVRGVVELAQTKEGASKLEAFIKGLEQETIFTNSGDMERRIEKVTGATPQGADAPKVVGNITAPVGAIVKGAKFVSNASKIDMLLRPKVINEIVTSRELSTKSNPIRMPNDPSEITHAYRNMSQAELDAARKSGYLEANPNAKYAEGRKWWSGGDEQGSFGRTWKGGKDTVTVRTAKNNVPENRAVKAQDLEILNSETGKFEPFKKGGAIKSMAKGK